MESTSADAPKQVRLVDLPVRNQPEALNMIVSFLTVAQKRGAFTLDESAKIWESIKFFSAPAAAAPAPSPVAEESASEEPAAEEPVPALVAEEPVAAEESA